MSAEYLILGQRRRERRPRPPGRRRSRQGNDHQGLSRRRARSLAQRPGARRLLGALVRPLQAADAGPREGGAGGQGQGAAGQDEHRRPSADRRPARHPVDPRRHRLQGRPAARRLHGRAAREPGDAPSSTASSARPAPSGADRGAGGSGRGARWRRITPAPPSSSAACCRTIRTIMPALGGLIRCFVALGELAQARGLLAGLTPEQDKDPAIAGARAALELAAQAEKLGSPADLARAPRGRPERPPDPLRSGRRAERPRATAPARPTSCSRSCGATAPGTRRRRASSSCSSSRRGASRTRRRSPGRQRLSSLLFA